MAVHLESRSVRRGRNNMANAKARKKSNKIKRQEEEKKAAKKLGISVSELLTRRAQEGFKIIEAAREKERIKLRSIKTVYTKSTNYDEPQENRRQPILSWS